MSIEPIATDDFSKAVWSAGSDPADTLGNIKLGDGRAVEWIFRGMYCPGISLCWERPTPCKIAAWYFQNVRPPKETKRKPCVLIVEDVKRARDPSILKAKIQAINDKDGHL